MSNRKTFQGFTPKRSLLLAVLGAILILVFPRRSDSRNAENGGAMLALGTAIHNYTHDYGDYPAGDNPAVTQTLCGGNPRHIPYLEAREGGGAPGSFLDPWGTPYAITRTTPNMVTIVSAGPDRKFGTEDDMTLGVPRPYDSPKGKAATAGLKAP